MRGFDSAGNTYTKYNDMIEELSVARDATSNSNGFVSRPYPKSKEDGSEYAEIQKALILMNEIRKKREMINNATSTAT